MQKERQEKISWLKLSLLNAPVWFNNRVFVLPANGHRSTAIELRRIKPEEDFPYISGTVHPPRPILTQKMKPVYLER